MCSAIVLLIKPLFSDIAVAIMVALKSLMLYRALQPGRKISTERGVESVKLLILCTLSFSFVRRMMWSFLLGVVGLVSG